MLGDNNSANLKFINLKQKAGATEAETPRFWINEKVNGKWTATKSYGYVEGQLNKADIVEKDINGTKSNFFILEMQSGDDKYKIEMGHGSVAHSIINSIASNCNSLQTYKISVAKKQSKDGKYWNGNAYVNVDGSDKMQEWSIDPQSPLIPKREPVMSGGVQFMQNGKPVWDTSKIKAFWEDLFRKEIAAKLGGAASRPAATTSAAPATNTTPTLSGAPNPDDFEDLPF